MAGPEETAGADAGPFEAGAEPEALSHTGRIMREAALHGAARPEPGEDDPREIWDPDEAPDAVGAMFRAVAEAFPDGYRIAEDREHVLWALTDTFRSMADRVRNRLPGRLARNPELEAGDRADVDRAEAADAWNARTADYMLQAGALDECLSLAAATYARETGRPWLVREGTAAAVGQISAADFRAGRGAGGGSPDVFAALRTAREMRARLADPQERRVPAAPEPGGGTRAGPDPAAGIAPDGPGPRRVADIDRMARGLDALFEAGARVFPHGCQLGDELASWSWRAARIFRFRAERLETEALGRLPGHPALRRGDPDEIRGFDAGIRDLLRRASAMREAFEMACGRHTALTGRDWAGGMRDDGAPERPARYDGRTLAAAVRLGRAGYPVPPLPEGPHVLAVGGPHMTGADRARVEGVLDRLLERHPHVVLHYGGRLKGADGGAAEGADPMIRRWADRRGVALAAHPPDWNAGPGMAERIRSRNAAMLSLGPAGIVSFGHGGSVYTRELLDEARRRGVRIKEAGGRRTAARDGGRRGPPADRREAEALWAGTVRRMRQEAGFHPGTPLAYLPRAESLGRVLDGLRLRIGAKRDEHLHWSGLRRRLDRDIEARNGVRHVLDEGRRSLDAFRELAGRGEAAGRRPDRLDGWTRWSVGAGSLRAAAAEMLDYPPESAAYPHAAANRIELAELVRDIEAIHEAAADGRIRVPEEREAWVGDQNVPAGRLEALLDRARTDARAQALLERCELAWPDRVGEARRRLEIEPETAATVRRTVRPEAAVTA